MGKLQLLPVLFALSLVACSPQKPQHAGQGFGTGIVGGEPVAHSEEYAKSTVAIGTPLTGVFCTGVLVAKNLVLTAAHCTGTTFRPSQMVIVFGNDLTGELEGRRVLGGKVTAAWPKLTMEQEKNWGDIALLKFTGEAPAGYVPARLLGNTEPLKDGMDVTLAGYGLTSMDGTPESDPQKLMKATVKLSNAKFTETEILFNFMDGKGACHGDSGGPAFAVINGKLFVIGVTSRAPSLSGGETCLEGAVYTSVPAHIEFLRQSAQYLNSSKFVEDEKIPQPEDVQ